MAGFALVLGLSRIGSAPANMTAAVLVGFFEAVAMALLCYLVGEKILPPADAGEYKRTVDKLFRTLRRCWPFLFVVIFTACGGGNGESRGESETTKNILYYRSGYDSWSISKNFFPGSDSSYFELTTEYLGGKTIEVFPDFESARDSTFKKGSFLYVEHPGRPFQGGSKILGNKHTDRYFLELAADSTGANYRIEYSNQWVRMLGGYSKEVELCIFVGDRKEAEKIYSLISKK